MTESTTPADPFAMTPAEAGAALAAMNAAMKPPPPIEPEDAQDARARLDVLTADKDFAERLFRGDVEARKQWDHLIATAAGGDNVGDAVAGIVEPVEPIFETTTGGELPRRHVVGAISAMRDAGLNDASIQQAVSGGKVTFAEVAAAKALQAARHGDSEWVKKLLSGDYAARREHVLLSIILASEIEAA